MKTWGLLFKSDSESQDADNRKPDAAALLSVGTGCRPVKSAQGDRTEPGSLGTCSRTQQLPLLPL